MAKKCISVHYILSNTFWRSKPLLYICNKIIGFEKYVLSRFRKILYFYNIYAEINSKAVDIFKVFLFCTMAHHNSKIAMLRQKQKSQ